ncbi:hypothetical protein EDB87DRAFT_1631166 [Lactarius vividus]|nr:hypothetical protein EDB87DRAFT_1631166 [Lactarius vividus]
MSAVYSINFLSSALGLAGLETAGKMSFLLLPGRTAAITPRCYVTTYFSNLLYTRLNCANTGLSSTLNDGQTFSRFFRSSPLPAPFFYVTQGGCCPLYWLSPHNATSSLDTCDGSNFTLGELLYSILIDRVSPYVLVTASSSVKP